MTHRKRRSDRAGRESLRSPGRPTVARREEVRTFWASIAAGHTSEAAAIGAGVSPAVGARWFRRAGGMAPSHLSISAKPPTDRYLSFAEREEIAILYSQSGAYARSRAVWDERLRRSRGNCAGMLRPGAAAWNIAPRPHSGMRIDRRVARSTRSWRKTTNCGATFRIGSPAWSRPRKA
jgi:hypothetical protein